MTLYLTELNGSCSSANPPKGTCKEACKTTFWAKDSVTVYQNTLNTQYLTDFEGIRGPGYEEMMLCCEKNNINFENILIV